MDTQVYEQQGRFKCPDEVNILRTSIKNIAVQTWRLERMLSKLLLTLDSKEQAKYAGKLRWFVKSTYAALDEAGLKLVNYEGQLYDSGIPATPINLDDFSEDDILYISQMIEPIIIDSNGNVVHTGTVSLQKK